MDKRTEILQGAAHIFETDGFRGVGIDRVIAPSGASTRTLYKHFGSRDGLVIAVLEARHRAFMELLEANRDAGDSIAGLFESLRTWMTARGARGCMLLRARSEYAAASEEIVTLVHRQKSEFRAEVSSQVDAALGCHDPVLSVQVWLLFEGATAAASVAGLSVIEDAKQAALSLLANAQKRSL